MALNLDNLFVVPVGRWQDTYRFTDGTIEIKPWTPNQIQNGMGTLIGQLMKETKVGVPATYGGIKYMAIGTGTTSWDLITPVQGYTTSILTNEIARFAINQTNDIVYLDPDTEAVVGGPTRMIQISVTIPTAIVGDLREFAFFGGAPTSTLDTGTMVNWKVHNKIEKDASFEILRTMKFKWLSIPEAEALF